MAIIQIRRGTSAEWTAVNPVLSPGELGLETNTKKVKIGDGVTVWNSLAYSIETLSDVAYSGDFSDMTGEVSIEQLPNNLPATDTSTMAGYQYWTGSGGVGAWSTRPTGFAYVIAFSDGSGSSDRDADAPEPTGAVDGDIWWAV